MSRNNGPLPDPIDAGQVAYLDALVVSSTALRNALVGLDEAVLRLDKCLKDIAKLKEDHGRS